MKAYASLVAGVILTPEQTEALRKANGGYLPDCTVMAAGEPGKEQHLIGVCVTFAQRPEFVAVNWTDAERMKTEARAEIADFNERWGHAVTVDPEKIGIYIGLEITQR